MKKNTGTANATIFVQIAAYRDPELRNTLQDLLGNADHPDNLKVCVAWQHAEEDTWDRMEDYQQDPRFIVIDIPYKEAKGVCWARNLIQQHYTDETYTLQLDSHHRFIKGWDTEVINMLKGLQKKGHKKPLITSYIPHYDPNRGVEGRVQEAWKMNFDRFTPEGYIFTMPSTIDNWQSLTEPVPARFYSAHFAFTLGVFCKEVPHDPNMYFHGEEPSIAVRAFTWGYDLFHPHKIIAWHEYTRDGKKKHWDDDPTWGERDRGSHYRYRLLHGMDGLKCTPCAMNTLKPYTFGTERTLQDYERYAGVRFSDRGVQQYTLDRQDPPCPVIEDPEEYDKSFQYRFKHCIDLYAPDFEETDYDFWVVSFEELDGTVIYRQDADVNEVNQLLDIARKGDNWVRIWREYQGKKPAKWIVWTHSISKGWLNRIEHIL